MTLELVSIPTDSSPLTGLLRTPTVSDRSTGAILMHGNGMNFYSGALRFLPPTLADHGITSLAFNRHGHDTISCSTRAPEGNAYQTTAEVVADNDAAARFLVDNGSRAQIVIGHSHGGLLAAEFAANHPETVALILLSAHCGGADMPRRASADGLMAGAGFESFVERARALVADGRGDQLLLMPGWYYAVTAASFVDLLDNSPVLLEAAPRIGCPVLFIRGSEEDHDRYPAEAFAELSGRTTVRIVDDCDHFYADHEDEISELVVQWLGTVLR